MKIVYLHQYFVTPEMAGGTRSYEMARRLVRAGHEVHVVTSDQSPHKAGRQGWRQTVEAGVQVHWLSIPYSNRMSYSRRLHAFASFAFKTLPRAASLKCDVVYATSTPLTIAIPAIGAAVWNRIPMVFEVRDLWPEMPIAMGALKNPLAVFLARRLERAAYRNAAHVVALSPGMHDGILNSGVDPTKVSVIPNSCDFDLFDVSRSTGETFRSERDWLRDHPLVVYTGTFGHVNGVGYLAKLAAECWELDSRVRFLAVGSGVEFERVRELGHQLGVLNRNFFMMPEVPKQDVPAILSAADVVASCFVNVNAMWRNSANKVFDAMAAGRPVAVNYGGWIAELVQKRGFGTVLDPVDIRQSAVSLIELLGNKSRLRAAGNASREAGRRLFDRDRLASQLQEILEAVVQGRQPNQVNDAFRNLTGAGGKDLLQAVSKIDDSVAREQDRHAA